VSSQKKNLKILEEKKMGGSNSTYEFSGSLKCKGGEDNRVLYEFVDNHGVVDSQSSKDPIFGGKWTQAEMAINDDGTWTSNEEANHKYSESDVATHTIKSSGTWTLTNGVFEFKVVQFESNNTDKRAPPQDATGTIVTRPVSEVKDAGKIKSLFLNINMTVQ
jgi:hypothetical protein